jgi:hypothetical protein
VFPALGPWYCCRPSPLPTAERLGGAGAMKLSPLPDAMEPDIHCVRTHSNLGSRRSGLVRRIGSTAGAPAGGRVRGRGDGGDMTSGETSTARARLSVANRGGVSATDCRARQGPDRETGAGMPCPAGTDGTHHGKCSTATAGVLHRGRDYREKTNLELLAWLGL